MAKNISLTEAPSVPEKNVVTLVVIDIAHASNNPAVSYRCRGMVPTLDEAGQPVLNDFGEPGHNDPQVTFEYGRYTQDPMLIADLMGECAFRLAKAFVAEGGLSLSDVQIAGLLQGMKINQNIDFYTALEQTAQNLEDRLADGEVLNVQTEVTRGRDLMVNFGLAVEAAAAPPTL